jgi:hypothetical protein
MFDIIQQYLARARAQDWFGGSSPPAAAAASGADAAAPLYGGGPAAPGVVSPAAETVLDEREQYYARSAAMDAKWAQSPMLARALARARGEAVDDLPIAPELGAPASERPLRDPQTVIAEALASVMKPVAPPAAPSGAGPYEEDNYHARRAAMDAKYAGDSPYQRAMARARGEQVDELPITPELGAPKSERPLRDPQAVIAEALASVTKPAAPPAAPSGAGPYEEENYRARRAAMDAKAEKDDGFQRAMARHAARKAGGGS